MFVSIVIFLDQYQKIPKPFIFVIEKYTVANACQK